ncbi:MAG: 23S rRNA (adenine(2503)-C(2))-methyltransferase RlmN [Candidatus Eremiobacteraeota bacterium]|nr:23S rRNA (adenine(2503)-C(2))-methyltransferase RlmN [Candidatus Eremiobacteraeota bacterium]
MDLKGMDLRELEEFFIVLGEEAYRGKQMMKWLYGKGESNFAAMTDYGRELRGRLSEAASIGQLKVVTRQVSSDGDAEKYLFALADGHLVESVLMSYEDHLGPSRMTACISTQVGCAMGCTFCASSIGGFVRNLTAGEIVDQVLQIQKEIASRQVRVANVVMMGTGEPLLNYDHVMKAVRILNHPDGIAIGVRHIAISTCGIVPGIERLATEGMQVKLAVSLHSANDEVRSSLMPVNRKYPLARLMESLQNYQRMTGRRVTIEYALIRGVNDGVHDAIALRELLRGLTALINLIPLNPVAEFSCQRSRDDSVERFKKVMDEAGIRTTVRKERGVDIDAACGQLRKKARAAEGCHGIPEKA